MANEELTLRQTEFLRHYLAPQSETFGNALQSALKAGYSQEYSENITALMPDWLSESIGRRKRMLQKAEYRLETALDSDDERVAVDVAKFIAKTQGKNDGYSERIENTGKDGNPIATTLSKADSEAIDDLKQVLGSDD